MQYSTYAVSVQSRTVLFPAPSSNQGPASENIVHFFMQYICTANTVLLPTPSSLLAATPKTQNKPSCINRILYSKPGVYKVPTNLISFPTPLFSNLISFPRPPYSGGSGGPPPWNFFENGLLYRAFLGHFWAFWLMARWVRTLSDPAPEILIWV